MHLMFCAVGGSISTATVSHLLLLNSLDRLSLEKEQYWSVIVEPTDESIVLQVNPEFKDDTGESKREVSHKYRNVF